MTTTLKAMVSAFLSTRRLRNLSPNTIIFYSQHLNKFLEFMESQYPEVSVEQIDHSLLKDYVSGIKEHHLPRGINHHIKVPKIFFKFMLDEDVITENPSRKISRIKTDQAVITTFSNYQIVAMLEVTKHQMDFPATKAATLFSCG